MEIDKIEQLLNNIESAVSDEDIPAEDAIKIMQTQLLLDIYKKLESIERNQHE